MPCRLWWIVIGHLLLKMQLASFSMLLLWQTMEILLFWRSVQRMLTTITSKFSYMISQDQGMWWINALLDIFLALWMFPFEDSYWIHHFFGLMLFLCRLSLPPDMLPQTNHPTTLKVIKSENATVLNVLVDMVMLNNTI